MYEVNSQEYSEVKGKILSLLKFGVEHGTSNLDPSVLDAETDEAIQQARDAVDNYNEVVEKLKNRHFTSTGVEDSHGPASVLDNIIDPQEQYESIKELIKQQGES